MSIPLLIFTLIFGQNLNSASRWIKPGDQYDISNIGPGKACSVHVPEQGSWSRKQNIIKDFKERVSSHYIPVGIICVLIAPANLSTAVLIAGTSILLMFIGRVNTKHILATIGIAMIPAILLITIAVGYYDKAEKIKKTSRLFYQWGVCQHGLEEFKPSSIVPKKINNEKLYQINQAKIAIAKGLVWPGDKIQRWPSMIRQPPAAKSVV